MGAWEEGGREGMDGYLLWFGEIWDLGASVEGLSIYRLLVVVVVVVVGGYTIF